MDKLIVNERGQATISNDGATIMKLLDIVHPAARILVDIAKSQDAEVRVVDSRVGCLVIEEILRRSEIAWLKLLLLLLLLRSPKRICLHPVVRDLPR